MHITDIEVHTVIVNMNEFFASGFGGHQTIMRVVIEVLTDEGIIGLGECRGGKETGYIIQQMIPFVRGKDPFNLERISAELDKFHTRYGKCGKMASGAIEMACLDLMGKSLKIPVYKLLGGKVREKIKINGCLGAYPLDRVTSRKQMQAIFRDLENIETVVENADRFTRKFGFTSLKFKSAALSKHWEIALFKALRDHFGPEMELRVDPNGRWSTRDAIFICTNLEQYNLEWIEDPCISTEAMARIHEITHTPIATNMCATSLSEVSTAIRLKAIDVILGDPLSWGGTLAVKKLAGICEAFELGLSLHSSSELGIATALYLHIAASTPILTHAFDSLYYYAEDDIITERFTLEDGTITVPEKPGLGVDLDHEKIEKYGRKMEAYAEDQVQI
jgi:glucarate dehydratase